MYLYADFSHYQKCGFQCEHCFEWNELNRPERLTGIYLKKIIDQFQELGISQVQLSGGKPLNRFNDFLSKPSKARH